MRQSRELDSRFISYYLWHAAQSGYIKSLVNAVRYNSADFGPETIKRFMVPVPTIKEQKEIADYLDGETRRIDSLIEAKKRQIDLYLTALDSKKNEIIWDISNARLIPLRYLVKCNQRSLGSETSPDYKFAYCDVGSVNFRTGISADIETFSFADAPSRARRIAQEGNIVFSMVRPYLRAVAKVPPFDRQLVFSTAFAVLEPLEISADYLFEVLTTTRFLAETERWSTGMSYPAINQEELLKIKVPFLDTDLQHDKIANLAIERANFIKLIGKVEDSIQALTEYKTTLIAAAVSGELSRIIGRTIAS
jgi:type I restriction enzyme S subunit